MDLTHLADILVATWKVSQPSRPLPQGQGHLDAALEAAIKSGAFPPQFKELSFIHTPSSTYCPELIGILDYANMSLAITTPNPTYLSANINLSTEAAEAILEEHGISRGDAVAWGNTLASALDSAGSEPR